MFELLAHRDGVASMFFLTKSRLSVFQVDARNIDGSTPLCDACAAGSLECVKLLLEHGATVNPPLFTFSPLHEACMGGMHCLRTSSSRHACFTRVSPENCPHPW